MLRKALLILSGNTGSAVLTLLRNLVIARLIPVEDYGVAATFAMAMAVIEMLSALGMQQQIVQARQGNDPAFQAGLQGFQAARGLITGAILFFAAGWIAAFLGIPDVAWAYQVLAVIPVLGGLQHFDMHRLKRQMRYRAAILTQVVPAAVSLAVVWPLYSWYQDFRLMLGALMVHGALALILSHLTAERRFALSFDRDVISGALRFGWPLLLNNVLLFLVFNGEKLIVGRELGMADLAVLAMGFTLTLTPTLVMARSVQSFFLPQLSAAADTPDRFDHLARTTLQAALLNGTILVVAVVLIGRPFVELTLGDKYLDLVALIGWMAILNAVRVFKTGGAVVALARGHTANALIANTFRVLSLPLSAWAAIAGQDLLVVVLIATAGEACGVVVSYWLVRARTGVELRPMVPALLMACGVLALAALDAASPALPLGVWAIKLATVLAFGGFLFTLRDGRTYMSRGLASGFQE